MYNWYIFRTENYSLMIVSVALFFPHEKLDHLPIQPPEKMAPVIRDAIPTIGPSTCSEGGNFIQKYQTPKCSDWEWNMYYMYIL